ncbi:hypothetical protein KP509_15G070200 [Ceratopteris richardii]|nr:hypothetical protein KP509_15G070200 [Ceratopteris richardii]
MKISSNILSPQNVGSTIEISGVISKVDATSVLQIEGMDGNGALPQIEGMDGSGALPQIEAIGYLDITSSKQQKVCVGVDIDDTSVRHENEILDGDKNAETCFLNGHDDVSCVDRNIASFVTPLKGNGDEVEPDVAFRASTRNDGDVSVPEGTPLSMLFSDFEKTPTDRAFHTDSTSRMKLRQSMRAVSRVSDKKKPGRQSRKTELAGTPGEEILPAGFAADVSSVNDKRSTGILKVSSNLKKHHTKDIANENTSDREEGNEICMVNTMSNCDVQQVGQEPVIAGNLVIDGNELDNGDRDVRDIVASPSCIADNIDRCDSVKTDVRMSRARQQGNLSIGSKVLRAQRKRVLTEETLVEEKISSPVHNSGPVNDVKQKGPSIREVEERQLTNEADCKKKLNGRKTASVRKPKLSNAARKNNEMSVTSELVTNVLGLEDSAMLAAAHKDTKHDSLLSQVEGGHVVSDVDPALKYNGRESRLIRKEEKKSSSHAKDNEMTVRSELTSKALGRRKNTKAAAALINQGNESNIDPSSRASEAHMNQENVSKMDASETPNLPSVSVHININSEKECQPSVMDVEDSSNRGGKQSKTSRTINTTNKRVSTSKRKAAGKENVSEKNYGLLYENKIEDQSSTGANQKEVKGHQSSDQKQQKITPQSFFAFSGRKIEVKPLQAIVKKLGGKICRESHQWSHQTTHLIIVGRLRRTEKLFAAAAAGRWILRDDYVRDSGEAGVLLDEMKYEWYGSGMTEDGAISFEAPRKWREHRERTNCCALEGLRMLLYGECIIPSLDTLRRALRAGGAELVATCPPYTKMLASGVDFAIVNPGTPKNDPWVREFLSHNIACVTTDFFVEFICKPSSSLERHTLYDTHRFVRQALDHHVANGERSKTEQKSIEDREVEDEGICCVVCGQSDREDVMLLCGDDKGSGCGTAMHTDCCNPPLKEVPPHDWYCTHCTKSTPASKRTKRRKGAA